MTQTAEPRAAPDGQTLERVNHWINGRRATGMSGRQGPVYNPATAELAREGADLTEHGRGSIVRSPTERYFR
jgi:hypothetical protein